MGQQEIFNLLKQHRDKWLTSRDVAKKLGISIGSAQKGLSLLKQNKFIYWRKRGGIEGRLYEYKYK